MRLLRKAVTITADWPAGARYNHGTLSVCPQGSTGELCRLCSPCFLVGSTDQPLADHWEVCLEMHKRKPFPRPAE